MRIGSLDNQWAVFVNHRVSCAALALLVGTAGQAYAAPSCTSADFNGVYGMLATGTIIVAPGFPPGLLGPFARVGRVFADGHGNLSIANTASYNGNIIAESYSGTYTVSSDCAVDANPIVPLPIGPGGSDVPVPFAFKGVVADNGNDIVLVNCGVGKPCFAGPTGNVIRLHLRRKDVNQGRCTNGDLSGPFRLDLSGSTVGGPTLVPGVTVPQPFARVGRWVFDGRGGFTGNAVVNYSGSVIQTEAVAGQYSVDSSCNVSITFTAGIPHTWTGTLTDRGDGADLIVNDVGVVITGTLRKQKPGK